MRPQEQIANQVYIRRTSANNGLPYRQQQQQLYEQETDEYEDEWPPPTPRSAIRYTTAPPSPVIKNGNRRYVIHNTPPPQLRRIAQPQDDDEEDEPLPRPRHRRRAHWSLIFGVGMVAMLALWVAGSIALHWWQVTQDDWHYGRPRTFQIDAVVGHNNDSVSSPSHFIAINYRAHIQVIEFPAGDTTKAKIYQGLPLYGEGQDLAVVTLAFKDINSDGRPDMIIIVNRATHIAYINDSGQFRPLKPGEQVTPY
jgi:hypothetical protein